MLSESLPLTSDLYTHVIPPHTPNKQTNKHNEKKNGGGNFGSWVQLLTHTPTPYLMELVGNIRASYSCAT